MSEIEMQFAAVETYQRETQADGFSSLFYNTPELISHMLAGTKTTGAEKAHDLLVRGLETLGLAPDAGAGAIRDASKRLLSAIEGNPVPGDQALLDDFEILEDEFNEHVEHLENCLVHMLLFYKDSFRSFP